MLLLLPLVVVHPASSAAGGCKTRLLLPNAETARPLPWLLLQCAGDLWLRKEAGNDLYNARLELHGDCRRPSPAWELNACMLS
jgi:hypothetical protein